MEAKIKIRVATQNDAEALLSIYAYYIEHTAVTFEKEVPSVEEFAGRMADIQQMYPYLVAECEGHILGYAYAHRYHERAAYDWDAEMTVYIRHDQRQCGIGRQLYGQLEANLKEQGVVNCYALVAEPPQEDTYLSTDSLRFHECMGYRLAGRLQYCGYKFGHWYHMVTFEKMLGEHRQEMQPLRPFCETIKYSSISQVTFLAEPD